MFLTPKPQHQYSNIHQQIFCWSADAHRVLLWKPCTNHKLWEQEEQGQGQLAPSPPLSVQRCEQGVADDHSSIVEMSLAHSHTSTVLFSLMHLFYPMSSLAATLCSACHSLSKGARFFSCCFFLSAAQLTTSLNISPGMSNGGTGLGR